MTTLGMPATLRAEFVDCTVYVMGNLDVYRLHLGGAVRLSSRLDEVRLGRAMRLLLDAEPVLGCRFDGESAQPVWRRLDGLDEERLLDIAESDDPVGEAAAFIARPFDSDAGPQVAAMLLRGSSGDTLAVRTGHVAADGGALKEVLYLIGLIYRELGTDPDWMPTPNVEGVREPVIEAGFFERLRLVARSGQVEFAPASDWGQVRGLGGRGDVSYISAWVEPDTFRAARALGRTKGATVNDVVLTALYRTFDKLVGATPGGRTPILTTVDLRKHLAEGTKTAVANISSAWTVHLRAVEGEGFDDTLARVVGETRAWKAAGAGKALAAGLPFARRVFGRWAVSMFRGQAGKLMDGADAESAGGSVPLFTNIGVIDEARLDFGAGVSVTDAWLFAPASHQGLGLAASTYRDRLHLSCGTEFAAMDERMARALVEGTARAIGSWVEPHAVRAAEQEPPTDAGS